MSEPYDPDRPAQPQPSPQSPPPWGAAGPYQPPQDQTAPWQQPGQPQYAPQPPKRSWPARHKVLTALLSVIGLFFVIGVIGAAAGGGKDADPAAVVRSTAVATPVPPAPQPSGAGVGSEAETTTAAPPATTQPKPQPPAKPKLTTSQEQAIGSAESYLGFKGFSRKGLIQQLSSSAGDGFSVADATYAVDHIKVDWKEQAVRSAKDYLAFTHFSRSGLIEQLSSSAGDGFTRAEATYAADKVGL